MLEMQLIQELISKGSYDEAEALCRRELELEPGRSDNYLLLGRVLVASGNKQEAIRVFRDGLLFQNNAKIKEELNRIGWRGVPPLPSLGREHVANRVLGKILRMLGVR